MSVLKPLCNIISQYFCRVRFLAFFLIFTTGVVHISAAQASQINLREIIWQKHLNVYQEKGLLTSKQTQWARDFFTKLTRDNLLALHAFLLLTPKTLKQYEEMWSLLLKYQLSSDQTSLFKAWSSLPGVTPEVALQAVPILATLPPEAGKAFKAMLSVTGIKPELALESIPVLKHLAPGTCDILASVFLIKDIAIQQVYEQLPSLEQLDHDQAAAAQAFASSRKMTPAIFFEALPLFVHLQQVHAINATHFFAAKKLTALEASSWLRSYFSRSSWKQEQLFYTFSPAKKDLLLRLYYSGSEELIKIINDLHAITDNLGAEIATSTLYSYPGKKLLALFNQLSATVKERHMSLLQAAMQNGQKEELVRALRDATADERLHKATQLTSANIYALLAHGGELYDSSFRDVLVPVLHRRLLKRFDKNLVAFLRAIDPAKTLAADFITSLALKGSLPLLCPADPLLQKQIIDVVSASALKTKKTILLFSATMEPLVQALEPEARSHLIELMVTEARQAAPEKGRLIAVILQYYRQYRNYLLREADLKLVASLHSIYKHTSFARFSSTPFAEWLKDGKLCSLSFFHPDDDGQLSFCSFARLLKEKGYRLELAADYIPYPMPTSSRETCSKSLRLTPLTDTFKPLFSCMISGEPVAFSKEINGINIRHVLSVYSSPEYQQTMLRRFISFGDEMLIQRGHSYWRDEQIIDPMKALLQTGQLSAAQLARKQRFLSLGSCGGVKVYSMVASLFAGSVDILATVGTGLTHVNNPFNSFLFELVAQKNGNLTWSDVNRETRFIFDLAGGEGYLRPDSLTAILHRIIREQEQRPSQG
ncbi:MAG: hypothetical protein CSA31_01600 [Desulfobulbus propionicus]|nr:MAG: hypothetical protein CSA31_01600 [Desulfobulbus propionicus]